MTGEKRNTPAWIWLALAAFLVLPIACGLGLVLLGAGAGAMTYFRLRSEMDTSGEARAEEVRRAIAVHRVENGPTACPTADQLLMDGILSTSSSYDPWGSDWRIECTADPVAVLSAGPDRAWDTSDDVRY